MSQMCAYCSDCEHKAAQSSLTLFIRLLVCLCYYTSVYPAAFCIQPINFSMTVLHSLLKLQGGPKKLDCF